jgi:uncharacterized protein YjbI with pentapeptide repeats
MKRPKADSSRSKVNEPGPRGPSEALKAAARPRQRYYRRSPTAFAAYRQTVMRTPRQKGPRHMTHLEILLEGVDAWNAWRKLNPEIKPRLREVDLRGQLLRKANLRGTDFTNADLRDASFRRADLSLSNLTGARLNRVVFSGTNLRGATFCNAHLYETIFADADLSGAVGLDECVHRGPSVIEQRTLTRSGKLPATFLRGCGLLDEAIKLLKHSRMPTYYSCFISYSSADERFARRLFEDLQRKGIRCWFAPKDIKIGEKFRNSIDSGIRRREKLLLILSMNSLRSAWVEKEVEAAFDQEKEREEPMLFPIRLDDAALSAKEGWAADIRRARHIGDFSQWNDEDEYRSSFRRLLRDLRIREAATTAHNQ